MKKEEDEKRTLKKQQQTNKQNNQKSDDITFRIEWVRKNERERDWKREQREFECVFGVRARAKYAKSICCSEKKILNPLEEIKKKQKKRLSKKVKQKHIHY